jgi:signal transduction histidine kinase
VCEAIPVLASGFRIEQLLDKLMDNAVASSPVNSEINLSLCYVKGGVRLRVENQGPLIAKEICEQVFESMFSTRMAKADGHPHMGLGLYIVRAIVESLGGRATVEESASRSGPVFAIDLPIAQAPIMRT